jgi:hypothetical protein
MAKSKQEYAAMDKLKTLIIREESIKTMEESIKTMEEYIEDKQFPVLVMLTSAEYEYIMRVIEWYYAVEGADDAGDALASICRDAHDLSEERYDRDHLYADSLPSDTEEAKRWSASLGGTP